MKVKNAFIVVLLSVFCMTSCNDEKFEITPFHLDKNLMSEINVYLKIMKLRNVAFLHTTI